LRDPSRRSDYDVSLPSSSRNRPSPPEGQPHLYRGQNQHNVAPNPSELLRRFAPILFLLVLFTFLHSGFSFRSLFEFTSNRISRKYLKGVLTFEAQPGIASFQEKSPRHGVNYFVPVWWLQSELSARLNHAELAGKLGKVADEMWIEYVNIQCELEKNIIGKEGRQCAKRKQYTG
jgi:hypothetical protein